MKGGGLTGVVFLPVFSPPDVSFYLSLSVCLSMKSQLSFATSPFRMSVDANYDPMRHVDIRRE